MKTKFKVFGLKEIYTISEVNLFSGGLDKDYNMNVIRKYLNEFDNEIDALNFVNDCLTKLEYEHGYEILKTYIN